MSVVVNLLPEARLVKLRNRRRKQLATGGLIFVALVVGTIIGTLLFLLAANAANESLVKGDIERNKNDISNLREVEQTAADLQEHLDSFYKLNADRLFASSVFGNLSNAIQPDVIVNYFEIADYSAATGGSSDSSSSSSLSLVKIKGLAKDYKAVSTFAQAIEAYNVTYKKDRPESQRYNLEPGQALFSNTNIIKSNIDPTLKDKIYYEMTFLVERNLIKGSSPGTVTSETNQ